MSKALIIYHSKTGTTRKLGEDIARTCAALSIESKVIPIESFNMEDLASVDYLFLGCWTHGLFIINQHPEKAWVDFAKQLPAIEAKKVVLFTTYKLATGSMFRNMRKRLKVDVSRLKLQLRSKTSRLKDDDVVRLKTYLLN
jgi:flavodoxin